jgi:hypothetical protein
MRSGPASFVRSNPTHSLQRVLRLVICLGLLCASAIAIEPSARAQSDKSGEALLLFRQGQQAARMMDWARAYKLFKRCYELQPSYDIAANLGQVAVKAGKAAEGVLYLSRSLSSFPLSEKAERRQAVERMFQIAQKDVATVTVTTQPADAQLLVDGAQQERAADGLLFLDPGQHIVTAEAPGYEPYSQPVDATAGAQVSLDFALQKSPGTAAAPTAAAGTLPGEPAPKTEPAKPESTARAPAAKQAPVEPASRPEPSPVEGTDENENGSERSLLVPLLIGGAATAIGVTVGIVYTASARSTMDEAHNLDHDLGDNSSCVSGQEADPKRCDRLQSLADRVDSERNLSYLGFGIAGAAAVATVTYLLWPTQEKPSGQLEPGLNVGAQHTIVSLSGRF